MPGPSELRVGAPAELRGARTRSHLADGRVVGWYGEPGVVVDAELDAGVPPARLAELYGATDFWVRWTATECRAKLAGVPIAVWLRRYGLDDGPGEVETLVGVLPGITVSVGRGPRPGSRAGAPG